MSQLSYIYRSRKVHKWLCSEDGTELYLSDTGYIRCSSVKDHMATNDYDKYCHIDKVCNCHWECYNHGPNGYRDGDFQKFCFAMSHAISMLNDAGASWTRQLMDELERQFQ